MRVPRSIMKKLLRFLISILPLAPLASATAGVLEGDLFGYRLGAKYPLNQATRGYVDVMGGLIVLAEKPEMPDDFQHVELILTPKSKTIVNIFAVAEFSAGSKAKSFASRYADLLETMHAPKCPAMHAFLDESLKRQCSGTFELTVAYYKPSNTKEKFKVHVGLKYDNSTKAGKGILAQFKSEIVQLESEGKTQRLEKALKDPKFKGLQ